MPLRYGRKKTNFKRRKVARRVRRAPYKKKIRRPLPIGGFGRSQLVRLRYCENLTFNALAGGISYNTFRANGPYDPNSTGVGHQPSNWDRWTANFDRYTVVGSRCTAQPFHTLSTGVNPGLILLHLSESGTDLIGAHGAGGVENIIEQPRLSRSARNFGSNLGAGPVKLTRNFSAKKFLKGFKVGLSPYTSDIGSFPTEGAFFEVAVCSPDDSSDPGGIQIRVVIDYIILFSEPKQADAS